MNIKLVKNGNFHIFVYKVNWPKMGLKITIEWSKTLQMSCNLDQACISMSVIKSKNIFWRFSKLADFWPKNGHLARFPGRDFETFLSTQIVLRAFKNAQIWLKINIIVAYYALNKTMHCYRMILSFGNFVWLLSCREGGF